MTELIEKKEMKVNKNPVSFHNYICITSHGNNWLRCHVYVYGCVSIYYYELFVFMSY